MSFLCLLNALNVNVYVNVLNLEPVPVISSGGRAAVSSNPSSVWELEPHHPELLAISFPLGSDYSQWWD